MFCLLGAAYIRPMKIRDITIQNITSFKGPETVHFDKDLNIIIGPNGGGKSNLLRIVTLLLVKYFLPQYSFDALTNKSGSFSKLENWDTTQFNENLDPFLGNTNSQELTISLEASETDILNMRYIFWYQNEIQQKIDELGCSKIPFLTDQQIRSISETRFFSYKFIDFRLKKSDNESLESSAATAFLLYLNNFKIYEWFSRFVPEIYLHTPLMYFSSARTHTVKSGATLANCNENNYTAQRNSIYQSALGSETNLYDFINSHFVRLRKQAEIKAYNSSDTYLSIFKKEPDVVALTKYLTKLGYTWDIHPDDELSTKYRIRFFKSGEEILPTKLSSGEKELMHFVFSIFALNVKNGLVIIDEPELHLHPKWQNIYLDIIQSLSSKNKNQFILATHSPTFINSKTLSRVSRVYQIDNASRVSQLHDSKLPEEKKLIHIVKSHNNERLFFADKVVLVEGITDRIVFDSLIQKFLRDGKDIQTIEVIEVGSKTSFDDYKTLCTSLKLPSFIIADLDYLEEIGSDAVKNLFKVDKSRLWKKIKSKKSLDGKKLCEKLQDAIQGNCSSELQEFWGYLESRSTKLPKDLLPEQLEIINSDLSKLKDKNIYVLPKGELEDYLPSEYIGVSGVLKLTETDDWFTTHLEQNAQNELKAIVDAIICFRD